MLKLLWGAVAAGALGHDGEPIRDLDAGVDQAMLAGYLFRNGPLPNGWGLHVIGIPGSEFSPDATVALQAYSKPGGGVSILAVDLGAVSLRFALGRPRAGYRQLVVMRPQGVFLDDAEHTVQKVLALAWSNAGGDPVLITYHGPSERTGA